MILAPVPLAIDVVAKALTYAGLELGEAADIFRRNPTPENWDALLEAMRLAKTRIARAEERWGIG